LPACIEIDGLWKGYGRQPALRGLSLRVEASCVYGLLGPNGAGKTTALKVLAGLLLPDRGTARIAGHDVVRDRAGASRATGFVPDHPVLYEKLSGREFLWFLGDLFGVDRSRLEARVADVVERFGLGEVADRRVESYSQGMRQKLSLAAAMVRDPPVYLIDEPIVGLDPLGIRRMKALLAELAAQGRAVLISTHSLEVARAVCHRLGILHRGMLVAEGSAEDLRHRARVGGGDGGGPLEEAFLRLTAEEPEG
jgi:ABC-2 type transport system ATP-binding protein